eukprot:Gb_27689 [translate_table: standard]
MVMELYYIMRIFVDAPYGNNVDQDGVTVSGECGGEGGLCYFRRGEQLECERDSRASYEICVGKHSEAVVDPALISWAKKAILEEKHAAVRYNKTMEIALKHTVLERSVDDVPDLVEGETFGEAIKDEPSS